MVARGADACAAARPTTSRQGLQQTTEPTPASEKNESTMIAPPRILIVDHDDSYTHNLLISLLDGLCSGDADVEERARRAAQLRARTLILPHTAAVWQDSRIARQRLLPYFDAVILSPGPGRPDVKADFGASMNILRSLVNDDGGDESAAAPVLPTLGVCLGHQGIAVACGARIKRAKHLRHGLASELCMTDHGSQSLRWPSVLQDLPVSEGHSGPIMTTYNSLVVDSASLPPSLRVTAPARDGSIYDNSKDACKAAEEVVMAMQHVTLPMWGVQFHPESIASEGGAQLMRNFMRNSMSYWRAIAVENVFCEEVTKGARERLQTWQSCTPLPSWIRDMGRALLASGASTEHANAAATEAEPIRFRVTQSSLGKHDVSQSTRIFRQLFEHEDHPDRSCVWLDSARPGGQHSRFSYMSKPSWTLGYDLKASSVHLQANGKGQIIPLTGGAEQTVPPTSPVVDVRHGLTTPKPSRTNSPEMRPSTHGEAMHGETPVQPRHGFWKWFDVLQRTMQRQSDTSAVHGIDFRTGFVGYFGYEMKHECLPSRKCDKLGSASEVVEHAQNTFPCAWFGFCDQVLAIDHETGEWFAIGLIADENDKKHLDDDGPLNAVKAALHRVNSRLGCTSQSFLRWTQRVSDILETDDIVHSINDAARLPVLQPVDNASSYKAKVEQARALIADGQSYEICLTTEFRGRLSNVEDNTCSPFEFYSSLRRRNPAPYSAYVRLDAQRSILSTSPEKFLGIRRGTDVDDVVEMKPIKGTQARAGHAKGEESYLRGARDGDPACVQWCREQDVERQRRLRGDAKEQAENLMIVDLIRRDLLSFCMPDSVVVPTLMGIETYETVHQMVTTVQGRKARNGSVGAVEAIARCFPPGSMTGAPKVRSVSLLEQLERHSNGDDDCDVNAMTDRRRGVYSGVLGWIGLDGAANFNVVIRTVCLNGRDVSVGAGGAITYHSNAAGEWQEVLDKVSAIAEVS